MKWHWIWQGGALVTKPQVPDLKESEVEKYILRPATDSDLSFIAEVYSYAIQRHSISCVHTPEIFKYELDGQSRDNIHYNVMLVIEDCNGTPVGYLQHPDFLGPGGLTAIWYELKQGVSWLDVTPSVIRYLWNKGQEYAKRDGKECTSFGFMEGMDHPVYKVVGNDLSSIREPYAFQMRVPNLAGFLGHIKPALEKRLAESIASGHSRKVKVSFYRDGLRMVIELSAGDRNTPAGPPQGHGRGGEAGTSSNGHY